ncbi:hypothetical protein ECG_02484 [Echinococcus granulosus]|nr:hypothetical protein ECG_02484 [Echinococcus granulosus]
MGNFRKNRSNEQLSRLKVRKVLGVGDRFGNGSISKISQILGSVAFTRREQKPSLIWWLRTLSFLMTLSVISSVKGSTDLQSDIYAKLLTICAFKLGISLALAYASFVAEEGAVHMAIVLVFTVFSFSAFASFLVMRLEPTAILECGFNMFVLVCSYLISAEIKLAKFQ